jgi:hypothetical protein
MSATTVGEAGKYRKGRRVHPSRSVAGSIQKGKAMIIGDFPASR